MCIRDRKCVAAHFAQEKAGVRRVIREAPVTEGVLVYNPAGSSAQSKSPAQDTRADNAFKTLEAAQDQRLSSDTRSAAAGCAESKRPAQDARAGNTSKTLEEYEIVERWYLRRWISAGLEIQRNRLIRKTRFRNYGCSYKSGGCKSIEDSTHFL